MAVLTGCGPPRSRSGCPPPERGTWSREDLVAGRSGDAIDGEAFPPVFGDRVALGAVGADEVEVGHEDPRLARDVGAHVPGVGGREQRRLSSGLVVEAPRVLGF